MTINNDISREHHSRGPEHLTHLYMFFDILSSSLFFSILFVYWFCLFVFLCKLAFPANGFYSF